MQLLMHLPFQVGLMLLVATLSVASGQAPTRPKVPYRSSIVELTQKAPADWILKEAGPGTIIFSDREYALVKLPKELHGGTLLLRNSEESKNWLEPGRLVALKDGVVHAIVRWKYLGKEELDEVAFTKFAREGWEEIEGEVETTFPNGEDWRYKTLRKKFTKGDVVLQLKTIRWHKTAVLFVFTQGK